MFEHQDYANVIAARYAQVMQNTQQPRTSGALMGGGVASCRQTTTEDLIGQSAVLRQLIDEYSAHGILIPKRIGDELDGLARKIQTSHRAEQEARLRDIEQEIEHLRSNEEKKTAKEREAEELRKELRRPGA